MLKIENLTKRYSGSGKPSVDNVSFEVKDGEIFGFIGPNGAGKSTTIKCIAGIISLTEGNVYVNGVSLRENPLEVKRNIGYVSDDHAMYAGLTGIEYINFLSDVFMVGAVERERRLNRYLELFELQDAIKKQIATYSHGMQQKLNIVGALIHEPKLWILDEPMTGLDPKSSYNLKRLMREHADKGNSVFFSSHVLEVVEKVCDRIGIIDDGHLITTCTLDELKERNKDKSLEELFLKLTDDTFADDLYSGRADINDINDSTSQTTAEDMSDKDSEQKREEQAANSTADGVADLSEVQADDTPSGEAAQGADGEESK